MVALGDYALGLTGIPAGWSETSALDARHAICRGLDKAKLCFFEDLGRDPSQAELRAGIRFAAGSI